MKRNASKHVALLLGVAGLGLLSWAALVWVRGGREVRSWESKRVERQRELKAAQSELIAVNLRYQAFQKSAPAVPDSVRKSSHAAIQEEERGYQRAARRFENSARNLTIDIRRYERKQAEAEAARKAKAVPFAAAGVGTWLCAAVAAIASRGRRDAA